LILEGSKVRILANLQEIGDYIILKQIISHFHMKNFNQYVVNPVDDFKAREFSHCPRLQGLRGSSFMPY
jgi:hypothetical protein